MASASLQRELNRLVDTGRVLSERIGNLRRFQANLQSPVYAELVALTRKTLGAAQSDIDLMLVSKNLSLNEILTLLMPLESWLRAESVQQALADCQIKPTEKNRKNGKI